jgi:DNA-directed RNA polymerase subunit RPC12/RpoP
MLEPDPVITCIDCGGRAFLLTKPREDGLWEVGEVVAYRCQDCNDRWDIVLDDEDRPDDPGYRTDLDW